MVRLLEQVDHFDEDFERALFFHDALGSGGALLLAGTAGVWLRVDRHGLSEAGDHVLEVLLGVDKVEHDQQRLDDDPPQSGIQLIISSRSIGARHRGLGILSVAIDGLLEQLQQLLELVVADLVELQLLLDEHLLHVDHAGLHSLQIAFADDRVDFVHDVVVGCDRGVVVANRPVAALAAEYARTADHVERVVDLAFVSVVDDFFADVFGNV